MNNALSCTFRLLFPHSCSLYAYIVVYDSVVYGFYVINCRGDSFRREFSCLGELRSITPKHVHVMVLHVKAMATVTTRREIIK